MHQVGEQGGWGGCHFQYYYYYYYLYSYLSTKQSQSNRINRTLKPYKVNVKESVSQLDATSEINKLISAVDKKLLKESKQK